MKVGDEADVVADAVVVVVVVFGIVLKKAADRHKKDDANISTNKSNVACVDSDVYASGEATLVDADHAGVNGSGGTGRDESRVRAAAGAESGVENDNADTVGTAGREDGAVSGASIAAKSAAARSASVTNGCASGGMGIAAARGYPSLDGSACARDDPAREPCVREMGGGSRAGVRGCMQ